MSSIAFLAMGYMRMNLSLHQAALSLGDNKVLDDIHLELDKGECLVLLGPSGCGKTTVLNVLAGALALDEGRLQFDGRTLDDPAKELFVPMSRRGFATVYQDFSLWPHLSVGENVAFGLRVRGFNKADRDRKVREALQKVRMESFIDRFPSTLSGGQQQRVAMARALAVDPPLLLLDEPLSALDAALREELKDELGRLLGGEHLTAVYVTHDQSEALALGQRIALMKAGRIEQFDSPSGIWDRPRTSFAAQFIGAANVLAFHQEGGKLFLAEGDLRLPARTDFPAQGTCFVRREHVSIVADETSPGRCERNQFGGDRYDAAVRYPCGVRINGRGMASLRPGAPARAEFDPAHLGILPEKQP